MHGLFVEHRSLNGHGSLSWDLAHHMYARSQCGKIAIVTDKPKELLASTRKQWLRLLRQAQNERARTFDMARAIEISNQLGHMHALTFSVKPLDDILEADITFATVEDFVRIPPVCPTVYVTYEFKKEELHMLTSWLPKNSLVVIYE